MDIHQDVPPLQIGGLQNEAAIREIAIYIETEIGRMQREVFALRQFLEVAVKNNEGTPNQEFNPLE